MYVEPFPIEIMIVKLQKELEKQAADLQADTIKGKINPSLENQIKDTREALDNLMLGHERMFNVALYMNAKANQEHDLVRLSKKLESELNSINIIPKKPSFRMAEGLQSMLPLCQDKLKVTRNVSTSALSAFFPFTTSFLELRESGVMMGVNKDNNIPIIMDIFQKPFSNPNGLVLSTSGAGKSYLIKLFILRQLLRGVKVIVVDPQKEYLKIAEAAEGEVITISKDSKTIINPFDLMGQDMSEKLLSLESLFEIMLQPTDIQKGILSKAVKQTYVKKGVKVFDPKTWKKEPPTLGDFYKVIMKMRGKTDKSMRDQFEALIFKLYRYVDGPFSFLNKKTNIAFNKDLIVFNIRDMPDAVQPVVMFLIMEYVYKKMMKDKEKKLLVIDEAWSLLSHTNESNYIFKIVKTCRKFNLGLTLITQEVKDLVGAKAGEAVLANTSYTYLLRQKPTVIDAVTDFFKLNPTERNILVTAKVGEGLLLAENDHIPIKIIASKKEHAMLVS
jgi:type IV secretory pathway VirB4 component